MKISRWIFRRTTWLSAAACLAIIAGSVVYNLYLSGRLSERIVAQIETSAPETLVYRSDVRMLAVVGMELRIGDRIETSAGGQASFIYEDEAARIDLGEKTRIEIHGPESGDDGSDRRLVMSLGRMRAEVSSGSAARGMSVTTPHAEMTVGGTTFAVEVSDVSTRLEVIESTVRFRSLESGKSVDLPAGHIAEAGKNDLWNVAVGGEWVKGRRHAVVVRAIPVPGDVGKPWWLTFDGTSVWLSDREKGLLHRIDPALGEVTGTFGYEGIQEGVGAIAFDGEHIWMTPKLWDNTLRAVDIATGEAVRTLQTSVRPSGIRGGGGRDAILTWGAGALWVSFWDGREITVLDPEDGATTPGYRRGGSLIRRIGYFRGGISTSRASRGDIRLRSVITGNHLFTIETGDLIVDSFAAGNGDRIWAVNREKREIYHLEVRREQPPL